MSVTRDSLGRRRATVPFGMRQLAAAPAVAATVAALLLPGCHLPAARTSSVPSVLTRARADLRCHDVHLSDVGTRTWRARGCGRYRTYICYRGMCDVQDEGVDEMSLEEGRLDEADRQTVLRQAGAALAACARGLEVVAIDVHVGPAGDIVGGSAEDLNAAQGACVQRTLGPLTLQPRGYEHRLEVVLAPGR